MQRNWIIVRGALAGSSVGRAAQGAPRPPRPPRVRAFMMSDHRGRIGVVVKTDASPETDKIGAKIEGVTPGGPADKAGLKVGDIITKFKGTSLAGAKAEDEEESGPGSKLIELARKLAPGDTARLEYRRGTDAKKATLVAEDLGSRFRVEMPGMEMPGPRTMIMPKMPGMDFEFSFGSPWGDLELASLNADQGNTSARGNAVSSYRGRA